RADPRLSLHDALPISNPPRAGPPAVGKPLKRTRLDTAEPESPLGDDYAHREGAAGQPLAIAAMARVDQLRRFGDLVADLAALTSAGLWKLHSSSLTQPHRN